MGLLDKMKKNPATDHDHDHDHDHEAVVAPKKTAAKKVKKDDAALTQEKQTYRVGGSVLVKPVTSEKTARQESQGQYTFAVRVSATKLQVKRAILAVYGVQPLAVNMINVEGKIARFGRSSGKRKDWKKAIVVLPKGKTIHIHEGV